MPLKATFVDVDCRDLPELVAERKADGWGFVQMMAVTTDAGVDLIYTFRKGADMESLVIRDLPDGEPVLSITDQYLEAFVFENEAHELFGVDVRDIAIDYQGGMYGVTEGAPMRMISPEQAERRRKAMARMAKPAADRPAGERDMSAKAKPMASSGNEAKGAGKSEAPSVDAETEAKVPDKEEGR